MKSGYRSMGLQQELGFLNPIETSEHEAVMNIVLTGTLLSKIGDKILKPLGLTDAQFNVLMLLKYQSEHGEMNQTNLGSKLLVNRSNVTGLIDRMEQAGWVQRTPDPSDRRVHIVKISSSGRRILEKAEKMYFNGVKKVMSSLSENDQKRLCSIMEKIRRNLKTIPET